LDLNPTSAKRKIEEDIVTYSRRDTSENLDDTNDERISASFESEAIRRVGPTLYSRFFRGYTAKQWQTDPKKLPKEIFTRLPLRFDYNSEYFDDSFQGLPVEGYASWINRMVESPKIEVFTNTNYFDFREEIGPDKVLIYTGPIDQFFDYRFGRLGWRTVDFDLEVIDERDFQGGAVKNYTDEEVPFTRIHEFKHLHPERKSQMESGKTVIAKEFSRFAEDTDEPFYPINTNANREKFLQYRELANNLENTYFGGRLATYKYLDMHMAIASALTMFDNDINRENVIDN
jgi:UDP-galactopyranose mutase